MSVNARPLARSYINPSYRRSDHPSFQAKRHAMIVDAQGASNKTIKTESGNLKFENGVAVLPDDSRAKDVYDELKAKHARHPNQFMLSEKRGTVNVDETHRYSFGWNRTYERAYDRVFGRFTDDPEMEDEDEQSAQSGVRTDDSQCRT